MRGATQRKGREETSATKEKKKKKDSTKETLKGVLWKALKRTASRGSTEKDEREGTACSVRAEELPADKICQWQEEVGSSGGHAVDEEPPGGTLSLASQSTPSQEFQRALKAVVMVWCPYLVNGGTYSGKRWRGLRTWDGVMVS